MSSKCGSFAAARLTLDPPLPPNTLLGGHADSRRWNKRLDIAASPTLLRLALRDATTNELRPLITPHLPS